ncbi:hypothetical protein BS50DRAFT_165500 [Corynespora cassiicola Philippines]|uniref:F-box domain-containing protein n=1 Tax=Corynespora cassiicola Philippines TaxID=1448308 RepID=A0A2T2P4T6_CORCC|nr:hypothetical protein BS50DRAFT_165500 [Corynespora cassiicola Philippines]
MASVTTTSYSTSNMTKSNMGLVSPAFPAELLLEILEYLPLDDRQVLTTLKQIHPRVYSIIKNHEASLTKYFVQKVARHAISDFPIAGAGTLNLQWLHTCIWNYDVIDRIMDIIASDRNCFNPERHSTGLINTGFFLLCQLSSLDSPSTQLSWLHSLPRDPLTALFTATHYSMLTARYNAVGAMHQRIFGLSMDAKLLSFRADVEFAFCEATLSTGLAFVRDSIVPEADAADAEAVLLNFYYEHAVNARWREGEGEQEVWPGGFEPPVVRGAEKGPGMRGRSLYTTLLERLADVTGLGLEEVRSGVLEELEHPGNPLAWITNEERALLVQRKDV